MKTASIAMAKNQLSRLLRQVRGGESILITDRNQPVARLQPVAESSATIGRLEAAGILAPPVGGALDVTAFLATPRPPLSATDSLVKAVLAEREEGR
ncbi:MAG: type II toxin-antitoxin system Phd/YefM family antitoxin [Limisphaerales bacterium]